LRYRLEKRLSDRIWQRETHTESGGRPYRREASKEKVEGGVKGLKKVENQEKRVGKKRPLRRQGVGRKKRTEGISTELGTGRMTKRRVCEVNDLRESRHARRKDRKCGEVELERECPKANP